MNIELYTDAYKGVVHVGNRLLVAFGRKPTADEIVEGLESYIKNGNANFNKVLALKSYTVDEFVSRVRELSEKFWGKGDKKS